MRHAKAGELAKRFRTYQVLGQDEQVTTVPTYRGEGRCFGYGMSKTPFGREAGVAVLGANLLESGVSPALLQPPPIGV